MSIKKIISSITVLLVLCTFFTACSDSSGDTSSQEATKTHTITPAEDYTSPPVEWANIGCESLTVTDSDSEGGNIILSKADFEAFAFDYIESEDYYGFTFKVTDEAAAMLSTQTTELYVWINDKLFEKVLISDNIQNGEFMTKPIEVYTYEEYCEWANEIRGF